MPVNQIEMRLNCNDPWTSPEPAYEAGLIEGYWDQIFPPDVVSAWSVCWATDQIVYYRWIKANPCCEGSLGVTGMGDCGCEASADPGNAIQERQDGLWAPDGGVGGIGPAGPPGPQGPEGPQGPAGADGTTGAQGPAGTGINIKGSVPDSSQLPPNGNAQGDAYITQDTGHLWVWEGIQWVDAGNIQGPQGPAGPAGAQGPAGSQGAVGPVGPQGIQGIQGIPGMQFLAETYLAANYPIAPNQAPTGGIFNIQINPTSGTQRYKLEVFADITKTPAQSPSYVQLQLYRLYDNKLIGKFNLYADANSLVGGQASGVIVTQDIPRPGGVTYYVDVVNVGDACTMQANASITAYTVGG